MNSIADVRSQLDLGGSEITVTAIDKRDIVRAGAQNRSVRNDSLLAHRQVQRNVREHPGKKLAFGVVELASHFGGAGHRIDLRPDEIDAPIEVRARIGVHSNGCGIAGTNLADLVLKHRRIDPHLRQIGDREQARVRLHVHVGQRVALDDVSAHGRIDLDGAAHSALAFQARDLARRHSPEA